MALKLSTGLRDDMLGLVATVRGAIIGVGLAFVDGGGSDDTITDSGNGFVTAGFAPGDVLFVLGANTAANDVACSGAVLTAVVAGTITFATGTVDTAEAGIAGTVVAIARGGSLKDIFHDGVLRVYSGTQPSDPDTAVSGTLLLEVSESGGTFAHAAFANGLEFGDAASGIIAKAAAETWQGAGIAAGTAGYFRLCANPTDAGGASTTLPRIDGSVGTSGADLNMSSTTITVGATYTIDSFQFTLPEYYGA
ncbi:MAG: hypothetical protein ACYSW3_00185 [Planctomycetota bacterium]|jgi:hypothetical protein